MNGQFKIDAFDPAKVESLVQALETEGIECELVWKKGNRTVAGPDDGANHAQIKSNDQRIFSQMRTKGFAAPDKVDPSHREAFLRCLKTHGFYSEPQWALGVSLLAVYWVVLLLVLASVEYPVLEPILFVGGLMVSALLWVLYRKSVGHVNKIVFWVALILGGLGYLVTTLYSMLALPLMQTIMVNSLYQRVQNVPSGSAASTV